MPPRIRLTREQSKARTRADLLRAAGRLFLRNGFVATSVSQIAEEAALTKGAVYSNFDSKEEFFLALLQDESDVSGGYAHQAELAPSDLSAAVGSDASKRARRWGEHVAGLPRGRRHVALFLEMNAFALRSDRSRARTAEHNREFFRSLGRELADVLEVDTDPEVLGLVAQSLYVGLMMHGAFVDEPVDASVYAKVYELLAHLDGRMTR